MPVLPLGGVQRVEERLDLGVRVARQRLHLEPRRVELLLRHAAADDGARGVVDGAHVHHEV